MKRLSTVLVATCLTFGAGCSSDATSSLVSGVTSTTEGEHSTTTTSLASTTRASTPTVTTTSTTMAPTAKVQLVEAGFTQLPANSIGTSYVSFAALLRNPSTTHIATDLRVNVSLRDGAGAPVKVSSATIAYILPSQTIAVTDSAVQAAGVQQIDVQLASSGWTKAPDPVGQFTTSDIKTTTDRFFTKTVATINSTFAKELKSVKAAAVYRNAAGAIIGGAYTYVDFVPAMGSIPEEILAFSPLPGIAATEVYVEVTSISALTATP